MTIDPATGPATGPTFPIGQRVRVVTGERHRTAHRGTVRDRIWHGKDECWYFYLLSDSGRKISKRYAAEDLIAES